jgi:hypothetical protein
MHLATLIYGGTGQRPSLIPAQHKATTKVL